MRVQSFNCVYCNAPVNCIAEVDGSPVTPDPGDASICFQCGCVCIFGNDLLLRKPTKQEEEEIQEDENIQVALKQWHEYMMRENRRQ